MNYHELQESWVNGNRKDVAEELSLSTTKELLDFVLDAIVIAYDDPMTTPPALADLYEMLSYFRRNKVD